MTTTTITTTTTPTTTTDEPLARIVRAWMLDAAERIVAAREVLTELDARIGDGDHGINLARGMTLVGDELSGAALGDPATDLVASGRRLVSSVGGASGPLYGTLLIDAGAALSSAAGPVPTRLAVALARGVAGVGRRGRSTIGQKTMLDTLMPASDAMSESAARGEPLPMATAAALAAGRTGCERTRGMVAQRGRASYLGERAVGHLDPGAVSSVLLLEALDAAASERAAALHGTQAGVASR